MAPTKTLEPVLAEVEIYAEKVSMEDSGEAAVHIDTPAVAPLEKTQTHATLRITGDDFGSGIALDADDVDAMIAALEEVRG